MKVYPPEKIRNVVLVGHNGAGKTTLAEALLYRAGAVTRQGTVEDGSTLLDYDEEEHKRGMSMSLAMSPFEWHDHKINLIDTPGYPDFIGDVHAGLRVADLAVFVVSFVVLGWLAMQHVTSTITLLSQVFSVLYFGFFVVLFVTSKNEQTKPVPDRVSK